jgi:hypothetical protein
MSQKTRPKAEGRIPVALALVAIGACAAGCGEGSFARAYKIESMAQTIGGPAAGGRPGDYLLENERLRAIVHGRHNERSTFPIANGSLIDLDIQRPYLNAAAGQGSDAFYELAPMVNLRVNGSQELDSGECGSVGASACPADGCARVSAKGRGDHIMGVLALLDLAILRDFDSAKMEITTDYDVCPGEPLVRVTTTARLVKKGASEWPAKGTTEPMKELKVQTGLLDVLLGETTGKSCTKSDGQSAQGSCPSGQVCDDLLWPISLGSFDMQMKRCRTPENKLSGVLAGDFTLFSAKVSPFIPGAGFDHESYIRSLFDAGGDVFSKPLSIPYMLGVADGVSYGYFNEAGKVMIPVFAEAFTAAMTNKFACPQSNPTCFLGKDLEFKRFVSVGDGSAASALEGFYQVRGISIAHVEGHVLDARSREGLPGVDVFVFREPAKWAGGAVSDASIAEMTYDDLVEANRTATRSADNYQGEAGIVSHFRTDTGLDQIKDGSFAGVLPISSEFCTEEDCRYVLVTRSQSRPPSKLVPVRVREGQTVSVALIAPEPGMLQYQITDAAGKPIPSKITFGHCFAECARDEDCTGKGSGWTCDTTSQLCKPAAGWTASTCRPDQSWDGASQTCACSKTGQLPLETRGQRMADGTVAVELASSGAGTVKLVPGVYEVVISRGFEYEIQRRTVTLTSGVTTKLATSLRRLVDTTGWISADFHVHGPNSVDSGLDYETRVRSYASEGVELITATDHDHLTDYGPTVKRLGLEGYLHAQMGVEVSPLDYGHFIGFPLEIDETKDLNGAFHWRRCVRGTGSECAPTTIETTTDDWENVAPSEIFKKLRAIGSLGDKTVVFVAHFYDHFAFYGLDPWTLELPSPLSNITAIFNKVLWTFSGDFDALEGFNGKNFDVIRRPTYSEIRDYNVKLAKFLKANQDLDYDTKQKAWLQLSAAAQRAFLIRTEAEQKAAIDNPNPNLACRCTYDEECGSTDFLCDENTGTCAAYCTWDTDCKAAYVALGRESCKQKGIDSNRQSCARVAASCRKDGNCTTFGTLKETCLALDSSKPGSRTCELVCTDSSTCKSADPLRPVCDTSKGVCIATPAAASTDPCATVRGTIDDWFQFLNRGVPRPYLGNSDSHGTYGIEAGCPRNYVKSRTDLPMAIDTEEIAAQVKAMHTFPTFGPFVELTLNGASMGSTVTVQKGESVELHLRIQSPLWFDVDRVEVYRNGLLLPGLLIEGKTDCASGSSDCIHVPNDRVVVLDTKLTDTPDKDAWYVVIVMGVDGKTLAPVYSSTPVARLGIYEIMQRLTPLLPPLRALRTPLAPSMSIVRPYAVTNPIFVDVGGDGYKSVSTAPTWAQESSGAGSTTGALKSGPSHDHSMGFGKMRVEAKALEAALAGGQITLEMVQQAIDSLRYSSFNP